MTPQLYQCPTCRLTAVAWHDEQEQEQEQEQGKQ